MGGDSNSPAWQAFVKAVPPAQQLAGDPTPAAVEESPLRDRLRRKAVRYGEAVPYGQKGEWRLFREGVKEMTAKMGAGTLTAAEAR